MPWQIRLVEYRKLEDDFGSIMSVSPQERVSVASALSTERRQQIIESLPKGMSRGEFKRQLYFRTYGEHLPGDVFKDEDENDKDEDENDG
jgi:hypothetical protein